jgi:hypothetical protein
MSKDKDNKDNFKVESPKVVTEEQRDNVSKADVKEMKKQDKESAKERGKPKEYTLDTLKRPLDEDRDKETIKQFKKMDDDEQKKFIIRKWVEENAHLDKSEQHEISLEDERFAGLRT